MKESVSKVKPFIKVWVEVQLYKLSTCLQQATGRLSTSGQKRLLVCSSLAAFCVCLGVAYWSIVYSAPDALQVAPVQITPLRLPAAPAPLITDLEYRNIHKWRLYLDSLEGESATSRQMLAPQGQWTLRDTLLYLEHMYHQQFK